MPCPECRIEFEIPRDGMEEMAVNDFIQKLWDIDRLSKTLRNSLCDFCSLSANQENPLGNPQGISEEIPLAIVYCKECDQKICEHCCEVHKRIQTTQNHTFLDFKDKSATEEYARSFPGRYCDDHQEELRSNFLQHLQISHMPHLPSNNNTLNTIIRQSRKRENPFKNSWQA